MASPAQLTTRYLPFLVVAAVLCLLVVLTPSQGRQPGDQVTAGDDGFTLGDGSLARPGFEGGELGLGGDATGAGASASGRAGAGGRGAGVAGDGGRAVASGGGGSAEEDLSNCDENGMQKGPVYGLGVRCRPVFSGDNGGATMQGVTREEIRYVWYNMPSNAVIDGLLAGAGFAREPGPFCETMRAYENSAQKYFEMSGRTLVALDGPGNQAGSRTCNGRYQFFQSQCPTGTYDPACFRADGRVIAEQLKPAFVLAPRGAPPFYQELGRRQTIVVGAGGTREVFDRFAPFLWGTGLSAERLAHLHAEYYCKRLHGDQPRYAGAGVRDVPQRRLGLIYPDDGEGGLEPAIALWRQILTECGAGNAMTFTYEPDVARAQQQAMSIVAQMRANNITTVGFCCDPVSNVFILQALNQNRYYPEHYVFPASSIASDAAGRAYMDLGMGDQWQHAFGISNFPVNQPDRTLEYRKAYADGGGPGGMEGAAPIEIESWGVFKPMMQMIHSAGPHLTPQHVFRGMVELPPVLPSKWTAGFRYAPPDQFVPQRDVAEVWWSPTLRSYYNDRAGAMCYVNDARRYEPGQVPSGRPDLFTGDDACARLD